MDNEEYLTPKEVAQRLRISVRSAQRLIKSLPHVNAGTGTKREILRISEKVLEECQTVSAEKPVRSSVTPRGVQHRQTACQSRPVIKKMERR